MCSVYCLPRSHLNKLSHLAGCANSDDFDLNDSRKLKSEKVLEKKIIEALKVLLKENKANGDSESLTDI